MKDESKELMKMKVVKNYEFDISDQDEMLQKWGKYLEDAEKNPEKYPKYIVGPYIIAQTSEVMQGVSIMEIENDEQIVNYILALSPPLRAEFTLLYDSNVYVPAYMATKK